MVTDINRPRFKSRDVENVLKFIKEEEMLLEGLEFDGDWATRHSALQRLKRQYGLLDDEPDPPTKAA